MTEPKSKAQFYIDSGWPEDNYEVTLAMGIALQSCGYVPGVDFLQLAFPPEGHPARPPRAANTGLGRDAPVRQHRPLRA